MKRFNKNKRIFKIIICILFSYLVQCSILFYLDNVLFKESTKLTISSVDNTTKNVDVNAEIPANAEKIQVSFNGRYIIYFEDNKLMLVNTKTSETKEILSDTKILNIKWVPNNNTLFIVENLSNNVNVKTYNANNGEEQDVCKVCHYKKDIVVDSLISSAAEYICVTNGNDTKIYRINIDKEMKELDINVGSLGGKQVFWLKDVFFYEDLESKKFYRFTNESSEKLSFKNVDNLCILKAAGNMLYMGEYAESNESNKKISKIIYGEDNTDTSTWKTINLEKPEEISDIYVNENNEIFVNNSSEGLVKNITNNKNISYKGKFISINERLVFSLDNDKVCLKDVKNIQ